MDPAEVREADWPARGVDPRSMLGREWLVANGLGGYAAGSLRGAATRRFHALLVAALPPPVGRVVMLNRLDEEIHTSGGAVIRLDGSQPAPTRLELPDPDVLTGFERELGLPVWRFAVGNLLLEKRLFLPYGENTAHLLYRILSGRATLRLRPAVRIRRQREAVDAAAEGPHGLTELPGGFEIWGPESLPALRIRLHGRTEGLVPQVQRSSAFYAVDRQRGEAAEETLWSPGYLEFQLGEDNEGAALTASTEEWGRIRASDPWTGHRTELARRQALIERARPPLRQGIGAELVLAADQFIIKPGRYGDRNGSSGEADRSVIAGYHWFTDWGRDAMISLDGLALATGRHEDAAQILRMFARHVRDGLIPNLFPEGDRGGRYNTADAALWFFHAIDRYTRTVDDRRLLRDLLPSLRSVVECYVGGTRYGIAIDRADGLVRQGAANVPLTWMDAKHGDWVVTPRRGKPVEINALWYNALELLKTWLREEDGETAARPVAERAGQVRASFNTRFWCEAGGYLYDVVDGPDGDDDSLRPNQIIAVSLPNPVLEPRRWPAVVSIVAEHLRTPVGLRSLAPGHSDYCTNYFGDRRWRDAAYHQGSVWPWLIGPFIDAWLKVHPEDRAGARRLLDGLIMHLDEACIGSVSEIFDAERPFQPRGCVAQAWSVAELLRAWTRTTDA